MLDRIPASTRAAAIGATILFASCAFARAAHAESVYRCRGADGAVAFQDRPCASSEAESRVDIAPAPPPSASPDYGLSREGDEHPRAERKPRAPASARSRSGVAREPVSYECRAANGEVFYRHGACPHQITAAGGADSHKRARGAPSVAVSATPLPRSEACRRMASAGSIGRAGHEHDDSISAYDRNLGRDPCRYL